MRVELACQKSVALKHTDTHKCELCLSLRRTLCPRLSPRLYFNDPLGNFVDLCYLANISVFALDERCSGYYIHGRNGMRMSDTDFLGLSEELRKEEQQSVGARGLIPTHADRLLRENQAFEVRSGIHRSIHRFRDVPLWHAYSARRLRCRSKKRRRNLQRNEHRYISFSLEYALLNFPYIMCNEKK